MFGRELKYMMYGFGDAEDPLPGTVDLVENLVVDYIQNIAHRAMEVSERRGKLQTEDLLYLIRHVRPAAAFISFAPFLGLGHTVYESSSP